MFNLQGYGLSLLEGAFLTLMVALLSLLIALILGLIGALAKRSPFFIFRATASFYTTIMRGIPDLVLMLLFYYGGQMLLNQLCEYFNWEYIDINPFIAGVVIIGLIFGAYMTETFRGAMLAVPVGQLEAASALGMTRLQVFLRILFPLMMRYAIVGIGNNWLVLLKTTALVSIIGLDDMVRKAAMAAGATHQPFTFYLAAACIFLLFTLISGIILQKLQKYYNIGIKDY